MRVGRTFGGIVVVVATLCLAGPVSATTTVSFAQQPGMSPATMFPMTSCADDTVTTVEQFQRMMFRPLVWYGLGTNAGYQPALSMVSTPTYSDGDKRVTFTLKPWSFADGSRVTPASVLFFLNMWRAQPTTWCRGTGLSPSDITTVTSRGMAITLTLSHPVNQIWFTANILGNLIPLNVSWDKGMGTTAAGCATGTWGASSTTTACASLVATLRTQGASVTTWTSSVWRNGMTGPYVLAARDSAGSLTLIPNPRYSGPVKAHVSVSLIASTSRLDYLAALTAGRLDVASVSPTLLPERSASANVAAWSSHYRVMALPSWGYQPLIINRRGAPALALLYVRQALQRALPVATISHVAFHDWTSQPVGAVPVSAPSVWLTPAPVAVVPSTVFSAHGWQLLNGQLICTSPGTGVSQCGTGVAANDALTVSLGYQAGHQASRLTSQAIATSWRNLGLTVSVRALSSGDLFSACSTTLSVCLPPQGLRLQGENYPALVRLAGAGGLSLGGTDTGWQTAVATSLVTTQRVPGATAYQIQNVSDFWLPAPLVTIEESTSLRGTVSLLVGPHGEWMPEYLAP